MKGVVEIYGTTDKGDRDLLYRGENTTTTGFSENIVEMLTTPSSISIGTDSVSDYLNSNNFTIAAFSMSKAKDQFKKNLHTYSTTNLLHNSNLESTSGWTSSNLVLSSSNTDGPSGGEYGHLLKATTSGGYLSQSLLYDDSVGAFSSTYFSATDFIFSVDVKFNKDNPPIQVSAGTSSQYVGYSQIALSATNGIQRLFLKWDQSGAPSVERTLADTTASGLGGIKDIGAGWYRVFVYGIYEGAGALGSTVVYVYPSIGEGGGALVETPFTAGGGGGSIYISRPQLELGTHPTNYVETSSFQIRDNLFRYSRLNSTPPYGQDPDDSTKVAINYYVVSDSGGPTLSGIYDGTLDKGVSAYNPYKTELVPPATPEDTELVPGARTPVEEAFDVQITQGQNAACQHIWDRLYVSSFDNSWTYYGILSDGSKYAGYFGRHLTYLGTYCSKNNWAPSGGFATSSQVALTKIQITNWVHYLSAYDENAYANPLSSLNICEAGILSYGITASMPDIYGYMSIVNNGTSAGAGDSTDTSANWSHILGAGSIRPLIQNEIFSDFSSTGEVRYHLRMINMSSAYTPPGPPSYDFIPSGEYNSDEVLLNLFGGVDVIGLWGFDLRKIREDLAYLGPQAGSTRYPLINAVPDRAEIGKPIKIGNIMPYRKYKLYSKKVLSDNMVKNEGFGTSAGVFGTYTNLDLYWTVKFL